MLICSQVMEPMDTGDHFTDTGTEVGVRDRDVVNDETGSFIGGPDGLNLSNEFIAADGDVEAHELPPALVNNRATQKFTGGEGAPIPPPDEPVVQRASLWLVKLVKEAVHILFEQHRDEVLRSWGTMLDQEEAIAYLICDLLALELLPAEARAIGKKAVVALKKAKEADDKLKGNAAARRSKARKAAAKDDTLAEQLDERLAAIDAEVAALRAAHWSTDPDLPLPASRLVPTRQRAPDRVPQPAHTLTPLEAAEQALAAAQDAKVRAERRSKDATRALAKVQPPGFTGKKLSSHSTKYFFSKTYDPDMPEEERQRRKALFDALWSAEKEVSAAASAADLAAHDVHCAQRDVDFERRQAEIEKETTVALDAATRALEERFAAFALERQRADAALAAARAEAECAAEAAQREEEAREEQQTQQWLAEQRAKRERESRELQREIVRSQWAYARPEVVRDHAAKVWGADWEKENGASPKVFRLVGKSADDVRSLACDVSQVVTDTEERVRLNRIEHEMLH